MTEPFFGRTIVASVTPFDKNLDLDLKRAQELAERFIEAGIDTIAVCPTTGECPTVFYDDKIRLFEAVLEAVDGRCKTIAYVGDNCTQDTVDFARKVEPMGFLIVKDGNVRMLNVMPPASNTFDRLIDMTPQVIDRIDRFIDQRKADKA